ncbi:MAG TPA: hypothetical protein VEF36_01305 [Roseiarcus sp.]|nr:hypothetical protein [Roseiarcus sp.]
MHLSFILHSERESVAGWRYLWAKRVTGFRPGCHCAGCLAGAYEERFGRAAPVNQMVALDSYERGAIIYFCGVSTPYRWSNNLHLPVRITGDAEDLARAKCYNGDELTIAGAEEIPFTDEAARLAYPARGPAFLTCRNFQFGAAMRAAGLL